MASLTVKIRNYRGGHVDIELGADEKSDCGAEPRVRLQNLRLSFSKIYFNQNWMTAVFN